MGYGLFCFSPNIDEQNRSVGAEGVEGTAQAAVEEKDAVSPTVPETQPPTSSSQPDLGNVKKCFSSFYLVNRNIYKFSRFLCCIMCVLLPVIS